MALTFYYLSGSPFSWRVWLALEHKKIDYELYALSMQDGDLKSDWYLAINPRAKAPAIQDGSFVMSESNAIGEYLEEKYSEHGESLWPSDIALKARARQLLYEIDNNFYPPTRRLIEQVFMRAKPDSAIVTTARAQLKQEYAKLSAIVSNDFLVGDMPTFADYALYPLTALLERIDNTIPHFELASGLLKPINEWRLQIEALPYFKQTIPLHWR